MSLRVILKEIYVNRKNMGIIYGIIIGGIAGWLAGQLKKGSGFGLFGNIAVGILGGFVGSLVFGIFGIEDTNMLGTILISTAGAVIFLTILNVFKK